MARSLLNVPVSKFAIVHGVVKVIAIFCGLILSQICLMAILGRWTESGWIRALVGLAINLLIPLGIVDRILPSDPRKAKGLATDTLALLWLGFPFFFAAVGGAVTGPMLGREAARLSHVGLDTAARVTYALAGMGLNVTSRDTRSASPSGSGSAAASTSSPPVASAPVSSASAGTRATAAPSASAAPKPGAKKNEDSPAGLFKILSPSVVTIGFSGPASVAGGGTGFLIDDEGTIATNHHVIDKAEELQIKFASGAIFTDVELLEADPDRDLALLRVQLDKPKQGPQVDVDALTLGDSDQVEVGERAIAIGNPLGLEHTLTDGLVSSRRMYQERPWIQMSVPVSPGNSGGPLFNMKGEVIGVTTAQILGGSGGRAQNLNLAVPINDLKKMIRKDYPNRRAFGTSGGSGQW